MYGAFSISMGELYSYKNEWEQNRFDSAAVAIIMPVDVLKTNCSLKEIKLNLLPLIPPPTKITIKLLTHITFK